MLLDALADAAQLALDDPLAGACWSPWQRRFLADVSAFRLARACNQVGKTEVTASDLVMEILGTNPYRPRRFSGPINSVLAGESIEQLSQAGGPLEKLWSKIPQGMIDPAITFERGRGLRGTKTPVIPFVYGPGAGSVIQIRTYKQSAQSYAGMTIHDARGDEPMPERIYGELRPRLLRHNGALTLTFTPTLNMPDQTWLRKLTEAGQVSEHHVTMRPENAWPEGYAAPFLTQAMIDDFVAGLPEVERAMRVEASWDPVVSDRYLTNFSLSNVRSFSWHDVTAVSPDALIVVGIDHGLKPGKQAAVLVAVAHADTDTPRIWFVDEATEKGEITSTERDAANILAMLARRGLKYEHVDEWVGDRSTGDGRWMHAKTNAALKSYFAKLASIDGKPKWIHTPHKYSGSEWDGLNTINSALGRRHPSPGDPDSDMPGCVVHPRCERLIAAMQRYRGDKRDPLKDVMDAARYAVERATGNRKVTTLRARY